MGCDIHPRILLRTWCSNRESATSGYWTDVGAPPRDRWYEFFGLLAEVRGDGPALIPQRGRFAGLEPDRYYELLTGDHSDGWATLTDMKKADLSNQSDEIREHWQKWIECMEFAKKMHADKENTDDDIVVAFNFDS